MPEDENSKNMKKGKLIIIKQIILRIAMTK
jgi:hypothetical protein